MSERFGLTGPALGSEFNLFLRSYLTARSLNFLTSKAEVHPLLQLPLPGLL